MLHEFNTDTWETEIMLGQYLRAFRNCSVLPAAVTPCSVLEQKGLCRRRGGGQV